MGFALGCFLPSALGKALVDDALGPAKLDVRGTVEAAISGVQLRSCAEDPLVVRQRGPYMSLVRRITIQDVVLGDQTDRTFREEDLVAELDRLLSLAPLDAVRVGLEDREDLVFVGNLLALEHSAAGLIDDAIGEAAVMLELLAEGFDQDGALSIGAAHPLGILDDLPSSLDNPAGELDQLAVLGNLLIVPLPGSQPLKLLHTPSRLARVIGEVDAAG